MASICDLNKEPQISYPNFWEYKVIFENGANIDAAISSVVGEREHKLVFSKFSKDKKYISYNLNVMVGSNAERLEIFAALRGVAKYVL